MKRFRFVGHKEMKIDKWRKLPNTFTLDDVYEIEGFDEPELFTKSIMKRMKSAQDGQKIGLRCWRRGMHMLSLLVLDPETRKIKKDKINKLEKRLQELLDEPLVKEYITIKNKLYVSPPMYNPVNMR